MVELKNKDYKKTVKFCGLVFACLLMTSFNAFAAPAEVSDFDTLKSEVGNTTTTSIDIKNDIVTEESLEVSSDLELYSINTNNSLSSSNLESVPAYYRGFNVTDSAIFSIKNLTLKDYLINSTNYERNNGAAIYVNNGELSVVNSVFENNKTANSGTLDGSIVMGGAIFVELGSLDIKLSSFFGNYAQRGGAVATQYAAAVNAEVANSLFEGNIAEYAGSAIANSGKMEIKDSKFIGNKTLYFENTTTPFANGGAVSNTSELKLSGANSFEGNIAERNGGALMQRVTYGGALDITGEITFKENKAGRFNEDGSEAYEAGDNEGGGAIYNNSIINIGSMTEDIKSAVFEGNRTTGFGGAIYNAGNLYIYGAPEFTKNISGKGGGAIYNTGVLSMNSADSAVLFKDNTAGWNGGAIRNIAGSSLYLIGNFNFEGNSTKGSTENSGKGGAIYNEGILQIYGNTTFTNNTTAKNGGAIYNKGDLTITGTALFEGNKISDYEGQLGEVDGGGAIKNTGGKLTIVGSRDAEHNASIQFINNSSKYNTMGDGGAISVASLAGVGTGYLYLSGVDFSGNSAMRAGAIRAEAATTGASPVILYINDAVFKDNTAEKFGGAISSGGDGDIYISNSTFTGNISKASEHGATVTNGHVLQIVNSVFDTNNTASGAVSVDGETLTLIADGSDTKFTGNTSSEGGNRVGLQLLNARESSFNQKIYFNAGNGGSIIFNDEIYGKSKKKTIEINNEIGEYTIYTANADNSGVVEVTNAAPTSGNIILNNNIENINLVLYNGTLEIGKDPSQLTGNRYFTNSSIVLESGTLDFANSHIENNDTLIAPDTLTVDGNANLQFDIDLTNKIVDYINADITGNGSLTIDKILFSGSLDENKLGESLSLKFAKSNTVVNTTLRDTLETVITSDAGYGLELINTDNGKNTIELTKVVDTGGLPVAVSIGEYFKNSTYVYSATSDETITTWAVPYNVLYESEDGNQTQISQTASNILKGDSLVINGNGKNIITTEKNLEGIIINADGNNPNQTLTIDNVAGWRGFSSAIINNGGTLNITNSVFMENGHSAADTEKGIEATLQGGAIRNLGGTVNIENTNFIDNNAVQGSAIYNTGTVNISAINSTDVEFTNSNRETTTTDIIYNAGTADLNAKINLAADASSSIIFNDKIDGAAASRDYNLINIGSDNLGEVIFNETVSNSTVSLNSGTLTIGAAATSGRTDYFNNSALNLNGGTLNLQNGQIDTLNLVDLAIKDNINLAMDFNLSDDEQSDKFVVTNNITEKNSTGTITISKLNLSGSLAANKTTVYSTIIDSIDTTSFDNSVINLAIADVLKSISYENNIYAVTIQDDNQLLITNTDSIGGFAYEVAWHDEPQRAYYIPADGEVLTKWIAGADWFDGKNTLIGQKLLISGYNSNNGIKGSENTGIIVGKNQELDFEDIKSYEGFKSAVINNGGLIITKSTTFKENTEGTNGGVIQNNSGNVEIYGGTTFTDNSVIENGGAIYNNGSLTLTTSSTLGNIKFENNKAGEQLNDIYQTQDGKMIIISEDSGSVILNSIAGYGSIEKSRDVVLVLNGDNSDYLGTFSQDGRYRDGELQAVTGSTIVKSGAEFFAGVSDITNSYLTWETEKDIKDSAKLTLGKNSTLVVGNSDNKNEAVLTIKGESSVDDAQTITINENANLILAVDTEIKNAVNGSGLLTLNGKTLTIHNGSNVKQISFESKSPANVVLSAIEDKTYADNLLGIIENGTNEHLTVELKDTDASEDLYILKDIHTLKFSGDVEYSGKITGGNENTGQGNVENYGNLTITGDSSGFASTFFQTGDGSSTKVTSTGKVFGGSKSIQSGTLDIESNGEIYYKDVQLLSNTQLTHNSLTQNGGTISNNVVKFLGSNSTALFTASEDVKSDYLLKEKIQINTGDNNTVAFENSKVTLGSTDFADNITYSLKNSELNLIQSEGTLENTTFTTLKTEDTNTLSLNIELNEGGILKTDKLNVTNGNAVFSLGSVFISGTEYGLAAYQTQENDDVLSGNVSFSTSDAENTLSGATTAYEYLVSTNGDKTVKITATNITDENSLYKINATEANRFFQFSVGDTGNYYIDKSLSETQSGTFSVTGRSDNAEDSILSGELHNQTDDIKYTSGSFFKISDGTETNLKIENLTITGAHKTADNNDAKSENGSVVENNSTKATVTLSNVIIKENSATGNGGAIYNGVYNETSNDTANLIITNTQFTDNSSYNGTDTGKGGAIYNAGNMLLTNVIVNAANADNNTILNDIYNIGTAKTASGEDKENIFNSDITNNGTFEFTGKNIVGGNISSEEGYSETASISNKGELTLKGDNSGFAGQFIQESNSGTTTLTGTIFGGTSTITAGTMNWYTKNSIPDEAKLLINNGVLNIGSDDVEAVLTLTEDSIIDNYVETNIYKNSELIVSGGTAKLNDNDIWNGSVKVEDGTLELTNVENNSTIIAEGGEVKILEGALNIAKGSNISGEDGKNPELTISNGTNLNITGGNVTLNSNDSWEGNVKLTDGTLVINSLSGNSTLLAQGGELTVLNSDLEIEGGSYIKSAVALDLNSDGNITIKEKGVVDINNGDSWEGVISLEGGTLNYATSKSGTLIATNGDLNLISGSGLHIENPSQVNDVVNVDIQKGATVNLTNESIFNLDSGDKWNGLINNDGGALTTTNLSNSTSSGGALTQTSGTSTFQNNSHIFITDKNSYITGGNVDILNNSGLYFSSETLGLNVEKLTMSDNSDLSIINSVLDKADTVDMTVNGTNNFSIDIAPRTKQNDVLNITNLSSDSSGTLNVSNFQFIGKCPIDKNIELQIFNADNISNVDFAATDKAIFTPIGNYQLFSKGGGLYNLSLTSFNPQVFRGQAATLAAYNHQLLINDMVTNHFILQNESLIDKMAQYNNKYAATMPLFAPYQNSLEEGGLWVKNYISFESLSMTHGLKVDNNVYGTLIGADFPVINLNHGWRFVPTAYIGYNGGNQGFNNVDMYQNGGQGGFMGTFIKNDFIGSATLYAGGYFNEMHVAGFTDKTGNWFAGTAAKAAYNFHPSKHFIIQPTALISYNIFGKQNWGTDFGVMSMNSGLLNGINVAPGVNLIYKRDTWSLYASLQYMYNINDKVSGTAGNVNLPSVSMRHGYIQYGVGVTKTWKDRLSSYFQINLRNGGRTGVGFQLGLKFTFGKSGNKKGNSKPKTILKQVSSIQNFLQK